MLAKSWLAAWGARIAGTIPRSDAASTSPRASARQPNPAKFWFRKPSRRNSRSPFPSSRSLLSPRRDFPSRFASSKSIPPNGCLPRTQLRLPLRAFPRKVLGASMRHALEARGPLSRELERRSASRARKMEHNLGFHNANGIERRIAFDFNRVLVLFADYGALR